MLETGARFSVEYRRTVNEAVTIEGVFKGVTPMGRDVAFAFETDKGLMIVLSLHIISMLQLEKAPEKPKKEKKIVVDRALYG